MSEDECSLCAENKWFFYGNIFTGLTEIRRCDICNVLSSDEQAGKVAHDIISTKMHIADVMTEVREADDWSFETVPCSLCMKRGWYLKQNKKNIMEIKHCESCELISSDQMASEIALSQIVTAFEVVEFAIEQRQTDDFIRKQTAKAFGEVQHQWMAKDLYRRTNDEEK